MKNILNPTSRFLVLEDSGWVSLETCIPPDLCSPATYLGRSVLIENIATFGGGQAPSKQEWEQTLKTGWSKNRSAFALKSMQDD